MSWTTPRTWVTGELVTAAIMNTHVRDNLAELGKILEHDSAFVAGVNTASSSSFDEITGGPEVTVEVSTAALVLWGCGMAFGASGTDADALGRMRIVMSGANSGTVGHENMVRARNNPTGTEQLRYASTVQSGLTPGSTTFTAEYAISSSTLQFNLRSLVVVPLGTSS